MNRSLDGGGGGGKGGGGGHGDDGAQQTEVLMRNRISGLDNLKAFASVLNYMRSVGKDLLIEVENDTLTLRALSEAKNAYAAVEFKASFFDFDSFAMVGEDGFTCKVPVRPLCAVCKGFKNVQSLSICAEATDSSQEFVVEMLAASGIRRTHRFKSSDCEIISAKFENAEASGLRAAHTIFTQVLEHLRHSPELILEATADTFKMMSFYPLEASENKKHLHTDLSLVVSDFDYYDCRFDEDALEGGHEGVGGDGESVSAGTQRKHSLIFCIKEFKGILTLCENTGAMEIVIEFTVEAKPIRFCVSHEHFDVTLICTTFSTKGRTLSASQTSAAAGKGSSKRKPKGQGNVKGKKKAPRGHNLGAGEENEEEQNENEDQRNGEDEEALVRKIASGKKKRVVMDSDESS